MKKPLFGPASGDIWDDYVKFAIAYNKDFQQRERQFRNQFILELNQIGVVNRISIKQALLGAGAAILGGSSIAKHAVTKVGRAWNKLVNNVVEMLPASIDSPDVDMEKDPGLPSLGKKPRIAEDPGKQPLSKKPRTTEVTPEKKAEVKEVQISPDGTIVKKPTLIAPPGTTAARRSIIMSAPEQMDTGGSGGGDTKSGDPRLEMSQVTKISRFPYAYEGIPKQYTTIMPFRATLASNVGVMNAQDVVTNQSYYVRMESVYDIIKANGNTYSANPAVVADGQDSGDGAVIQRPYWREYWMQFYEYWTVLETRVKLNCWITGTNGTRAAVMYWGYTGLQKVPLEYGNPAVPLRERDYDRMKGFKKIFLRPNPDGSRHQFENSKQISFVYHRGDGVHEVAEDELVQTWIKGDNVPKEQNNLTIILTSPQNTNGLTTGINIEIEIEYVVQMKDLKAIYQFPTPALDKFSQIIA